MTFFPSLPPRASGAARAAAARCGREFDASGCGRRTCGGSGAGSAEIPFQPSQVAARGGPGWGRGCPEGPPRGRRAAGRGARPVPAAAGGSTRPGPANEFSPWDHRPGCTAKPTPRATRGASNRTESGLVPRGRGENTRRLQPPLEPAAGQEAGGLSRGEPPALSRGAAGQPHPTVRCCSLRFISFSTEEKGRAPQPDGRWRGRAGGAARVKWGPGEGGSPGPCPAGAVNCRRQEGEVKRA